MRMKGGKIKQEENSLVKRDSNLTLDDTCE
jgi:hypothetical protein